MYLTEDQKVWVQVEALSFSPLEQVSSYGKQGGADMNQYFKEWTDRQKDRETKGGMCGREGEGTEGMDTASLHTAYKTLQEWPQWLLCPWVWSWAF